MVLALQEAALDEVSPGNEQLNIAAGADNLIFTRASKPFKTECVVEILRLVKIGEDISAEEHILVEDLVRDFADMFALSVHEVKHIPGVTHHLEVPNDTQLHMKIGQKPMTPPQVAYFSEAIDIMVEARICAPIAVKGIKCVSPITLAVKAHSMAGMTMDKLCQKVNLECKQIGILNPYIGPCSVQPMPEVQKTQPGVMQPQKWRVCTNYQELNKVTQVLPMPQGSIWSKQQALCGHRWVSIFDFTAGFYAVEVTEESCPCTAY